MTLVVLNGSLHTQLGSKWHWNCPVLPEPVGLGSFAQLIHQAIAQDMGKLVRKEGVLSQNTVSGCSFHGGVAHKVRPGCDWSRQCKLLLLEVTLNVYQIQSLVMRCTNLAPSQSSFRLLGWCLSAAVRSKSTCSPWRSIKTLCVVRAPHINQEHLDGRDIL